MAVLLVVIALLAAGVGVLCLSQATLGVGLIGLACLLGILARIAQADRQTQRLMGALAEVEETTKLILLHNGKDAAQLVGAVARISEATRKLILDGEPGD